MRSWNITGALNDYIQLYSAKSNQGITMRFIGQTYYYWRYFIFGHLPG